MSRILRSALLSLLFLLSSICLFGQAEVTAWGNIEGIRIDGQLMEFGSAVVVVGQDWNQVHVTGKERQYSQYGRKGPVQFSDVRIDSLFFKHRIENTGRGKVEIGLDFVSQKDTSLTGVYYGVELPVDIYENGTMELIEPSPMPLSRTQPSAGDEILRVFAKGIRFSSPTQNLEVKMDSATRIIAKSIEGPWGKSLGVLLEIASDSIKKAEEFSRQITVIADGEMDTEEVSLTLDPTAPGRKFDGIGGNFRLQNQRTDPPVIDYCLENLRVSWARVELPWRLWQPDENTDPMTTELHPHVRRSMELAKRLYDKGIPVMLADWSAPDWAVIGEYSSRPRNGVWGNELDSTKMDKIYESLTKYMLYLKENYGVEVEMFSFNESDLGINVKQTGEEHARLIKEMGAYMKSKGLKTRLLFGDTADIRGWPFLKAGMDDPETHPYMGAVSFHSWRGWEDENLLEWTKASRELDLPLIVGEGSIDAAAWRYPAIFLEPLYARNEINLYVKIMALCQPLTILQWQLTADYSALAGGGIFGNDSTDLHPTQRFFNLKQLGSTPKGLKYLPLTSSKENITCTALGDEKGKQYAIHVVNNGATRKVTLDGLPRKVKKLQVYKTSETSGMEKIDEIKVKKGVAEFTLEAVSFVSLFSEI